MNASSSSWIMSMFSFSIEMMRAERPRGSRQLMLKLPGFFSFSFMPFLTMLVGERKDGIHVILGIDLRGPTGHSTGVIKKKSTGLNRKK